MPGCAQLEPSLPRWHALWLGPGEGERAQTVNYRVFTWNSERRFLAQQASVCSGQTGFRSP